MKVLSLFDGISAGQLAIQRAGISVDAYYASEVDKYAISVTQNAYPHFPDNWTEGISDTQRYKALGNSWTVDVVAHIFKNL